MRQASVGITHSASPPRWLQAELLAPLSAQLNVYLTEVTSHPVRSGGTGRPMKGGGSEMRGSASPSRDAAGPTPAPRHPRACLPWPRAVLGRCWGRLRKTGGTGRPATPRAEPRARDPGASEPDPDVPLVAAAGVATSEPPTLPFSLRRPGALRTPSAPFPSAPPRPPAPDTWGKLFPRPSIQTQLLVQLPQTVLSLATRFRP